MGLVRVRHGLGKETCVNRDPVHSITLKSGVNFYIRCLSVEIGEE